MAFQRQRTGGGLHPVVRIDVVLDQNRNAVQCAARLPRFAFLIERIGNFQCIGVQLDHRIEIGTVFVYLSRYAPDTTRRADAPSTRQIPSFPEVQRSSTPAMIIPLAPLK